MRKHYWIIVGVCFAVVNLIIFQGLGLYAQEDEPRYFETQFTKLGVQYRFENGWADQFSGKIKPINESSFIVEWFRYNETNSIKNSTFHNPRAEYYTVDIWVELTNDTTRTKGSFYVTWLNWNKEAISYDIDQGIIWIRDNTLTRRIGSEIIKVRKYDYDVGEFQ